jgi:hypothetical protein
MTVRIELRPAWDSIVESFREHPVRTIIRLAVVVYVVGLIVVLLIGVVDGPRVNTLMEP